ncbi:MAG: alpha-L-fucosidase [Candidatus Latescibacteria bacterium]|nr:alpha-L-fucosidase [Candidatus Latescibacterota bacterium]
MRRIKAFPILAVLAVVLDTTAVDAQSYLKASPDDMAWWRDAKFGLFIHWGPVSLKGTEIGWSRGGERRGRGGTGSIPVDVYDNLYREFNPVEFDAREWVALAKDAGMKYLVFTTKHHDGFSMFDSAVTDYKITSPVSPFGRDVAAELADACHDAGIRLGFYYSPVDWRHPDYRTPNHDRYIKFMHEQVRELCANYGEVDVLWFDGLQIHPMSGRGGETYYDPGWAKDWDSQRLFRTIRSLQPHVIINNRCGLEGDFDTPEQHVGFYQVDRPWESCITICRQWAWKPDDAMKSLDECIRTLVMCAGGDGNLLLNVGPMPTGKIEKRQADRLHEIGGWLRVNGESIYGTRGGPIPPKSWGVTTHKGNTVYLHVLAGSDELIAVPPLTEPIRSAVLLDGSPVETTGTPFGVLVRLAREKRDASDTVVALTFDRKPTLRESR